jgi:hypothetical protein
MHRVRASLLVATICSYSLQAQEVPEPVRLALRVRLPKTCWEAPTITPDSVSFFPGLRLYVGSCTTYFGAPCSAAVGLDSTGLLYLLDSPTSFEFLEARLGHPVLDSANLVSYGFDAARLSAQIPWDAVLQRDTVMHPDLRTLDPLFPLDGDCGQVKPPWILRGEAEWVAGFAAATAWWFGTVTVHMIDGHLLYLETRTRCEKMHNP